MSRVTSRVAPRRCAVLAALLVALPAASPAQTTLDLFVQQYTGGNYLVRVDPDGPRVVSLRTLTAAEDAWAGGAVTSDGRFLVSATAELQTQFPEPFNVWELTIHDLVAGGTLRLPRGKDLPVFALHPRRTEIVWSDSVSPMVLGAGGPRRLAGCGYGSVGSLSGDGSRAVYQCFSGSTHIVVDVDRGGLVADLGISYGPRPVLNADGRDAYDLDTGQLRRRSVDTGMVLAQVAVPGEQALSIDAIHLSPRTGEVFVLGNGISVFDGVSLAVTRSRSDALQTASVTSWVFDPDRPRIYAAVHEGGAPWFWILDSDTLQVVSRTPIPGNVGYVTMRRVPTPAAPARLAATVQGASVTLAWAEGLPVAQSLRYELEVGSAPGLTDIFTGLDVGLQTSFAASGVPPGRYYVRVRAGNYAGVSAPSNEVVVQVP